jgi:hypothetical protein
VVTVGYQPEPESRTLRDTVAQITCPYARVIVLVFSILLVFVLLALASIAALSPPNDSYYVAIMVVALDVPVLLFLGGLLYLCRQYRRRF